VYISFYSKAFWINRKSILLSTWYIVITRNKRQQRTNRIIHFVGVVARCVSTVTVSRVIIMVSWQYERPSTDISFGHVLPNSVPPSQVDPRSSFTRYCRTRNNGRPCENHFRVHDAPSAGYAATRTVRPTGPGGNVAARPRGCLNETPRAFARYCLASTRGAIVAHGEYGCCNWRGDVVVDTYIYTRTYVRSLEDAARSGRTEQKIIIVVHRAAEQPK